MSPTAASCPDTGKLIDLQANALPFAEAEEIRQHILNCQTCQAKVPRGDTQDYSGISIAGASDETTPQHQPPEARMKQFGPDWKPDFLRPPVNPDELGRLGSYRVLRIIGKGGMGIVFEAQDIGLERRVALKVLRPDLVDEAYRLRFLREARAAASLPHDHIVTIYQVGEDNGVPYLAMEYLQGESLETRLRRDNWLPVAKALEITRQAAEGLAAAHEKGLIHRDVKPDNLWLESNKNLPAERVKLLDFGLARSAHVSSELTAPGHAVGTPGYMAPEAVYGLLVDGRSDLYALGCVLYRMLTGKIPFADESFDTRALLRAVAEKDVPPADTVTSGIPAPVAALLKDLLARDPDQRPLNARAVIARIRSLEQESRAPEKKAAAKSSPSRETRLRVGVWAGALTILISFLVGGAVLFQRIISCIFSPPAAESEQVGGGMVAGEPIRVGLLYSLSGSLSYSEKPVRDATLQAIREINEKGGVLGRLIEPVTEDGGSEEETFARKAEELLNEKKVITLFGCWTSSSRKRVEEICARHDRLLVYAVPDEGLEQSPFVFYLGGTPNQLMVPAVRWTYADLRKRRFFLVGSDYVFSKAAHIILRHEVKELSGTIAGEAFRPLGDTDFTGIAEEIKNSKADIILCTVDSLSNVAFAQALRSKGLRPPEVPTVWFNVGENELRYMNDRRQMAGDYAPFCYFQSLNLPANKAFLERFRKDSDDPMLSVTDPMEASYCGVYLWKQAIEAAKTTDTAPLREAFRQQTFNAPEGPIRIDAATQRAWRTPRIGRVNDQLNFDVVWAAPEWVEPVPYPSFRTKEQWEQFLQSLYKDWGGHWEKHDR